MSVEEALEIRQEIDLGALSWPTREMISSGEVGGMNRLYEDFRGCSWKLARDVIELEECILNRWANATEEASLDEFIGDEEAEDLYGLDPGIAAAVIALSAAGCATVASCSGGPGHSEAHPLVAFYCRPAGALDLMEVAEEAGCGLENINGGMLLLYSDHINSMVEFGRRLWSRRRKLRKVREQHPKASRAQVSYEQLSLPLDGP